MKHIRERGFGLALIRLILILVVLSLIQGSSFNTQAQSGGALGYGSKVYGVISASAPLVTYSFTGQQGDYVVMTADSWTGTLDVQLEFVAPNGVVLDRSTQNTPAGEALGAHLAVFLPESGIYVLRLSGEHATTGDYLLSVLGRAAATATPLVYGQAVDVIIPAGAAAQFFAFEAEDCPTTLVVSDPSEGQPFTFRFIVKVRDQRGQTVALLRGGEQLEDWVTVEALSGRYEVEALAEEPALSGSIRLLVTCADDNPGCTPTGQSGAAVCAPCPPIDELVPGGGCPDLHFTAVQDPAVPNWVTVTWDLMPGADGYAVYVTGLIEGGGETYLTHADWVPGDPTRFTWILPAVGYTGFNFSLRVLVDDVVICTQEAHVDMGTPAPDCPDMGLTAAMTDAAVHALTLGWTPGLDADQFDLDIYSIMDGSETYSGRLILPGDASEYAFDHFPPELDAVRFVLWMWKDGRLCSEEITVVFTQPPDQQGGGPCAIRADREGVPVRVGPGASRSIFAFLNPGIEYTVAGQAIGEDGNPWWQIDKTQFAGHEGVISLWVAQADVAEVGDCSQVPQTDIPGVIPIPDDQPGGWLPCGSCDSCGHPANECVTSPEGLCLWDPTTCQNFNPNPPGGDQTCYAVYAVIDMGNCSGGGSAMLDTVPNCRSTLYTPGTLIQAHAVAVDSKCRVRSWTGCGASGSGASISFIPPGTCTVVAHMGY
ncbi:MAG: hypothetical protein JNL42_13680 [Anaerolineae bacterium]|nr:hypothetical protein [Anaerolineae bacterium]